MWLHSGTLSRGVPEAKTSLDPSLGGASGSTRALVCAVGSASIQRKLVRAISKVAVKFWGSRQALEHRHRLPRDHRMRFGKPIKPPARLDIVGHPRAGDVAAWTSRG